MVVLERWVLKKPPAPQQPPFGNAAPSKHATVYPSGKIKSLTFSFGSN
jgi:hypothetical protein